VKCAFEVRGIVPKNINKTNFGLNIIFPNGLI
jgi:hypothetical protein